MKGAKEPDPWPAGFGTSRRVRDFSRMAALTRHSGTLKDFMTIEDLKRMRTSPT
jgi:hypothetical protein